MGAQEAAREDDPHESLALNAEIMAAVEENLRHVHYGHEVAETGVTTVALDEHGRLVEHRPDGSNRVIREETARHRLDHPPRPDRQD